MMKSLIVSFIFLTISLFWFPKTVDARSGCCSWHGGVSYCDTSVGRYVCNDGTYSPSCACYLAPKAVSIPTKAPIIYTPKSLTPRPTIIIIKLTPTPVFIETPVATPGVKAASTEELPSPTPRPTTTSDTFIGLGVLGLASWAGWKALKWLGRKAGETQKDSMH